jgi:hypothetical protein
MIRLDRAAGLACTIAGLLLVTGLLSPGPAIAAGPAAITDPGGDTINRDTNAKLAAAAADIVSATIDSGASGIILSFRTQQLSNPATDPGWASGNTSASWQLDENGDGKVDDIISYSADPSAPGGIAGDLTHWPGPNQPATKCSVPAGFDPVAGYTLTVTPTCVGKPTAVSYRVQVTYDTSPGAKKPPLAFDVAPDQGLAGPVAINVPTAPAAAPPPAGAPAPPAAGPEPGAAAPAPPSSAAPAVKPAAPPATRAAPKPTPSTAPARRPAASAPPAAAQPNAAPAPPGGLAATGADSRRLGALGGGLLLLGGLVLLIRPKARPAS